MVIGSFSANPATSYPGDYLLLILAFYLMIGYLLLGQWSRPQSPWSRLLGTTEGSLLPSWLAIPWVSTPPLPPPGRSPLTTRSAW